MTMRDKTAVCVPGDGHRIAASLGTTLLHCVKCLLPDYAFLLLSHRRRVGRWPNLTHPSTFNEMILNRCLRPDLRWAELTDKLSVREYVKHKIGEDHLIPLVSVPEAFTRDVFESLPVSFVMKATHGCGFVEVVRDKSETSFEKLNRLAGKWRAVNFYRASRERHYRFIRPRIYFEELLLDETGKIPADLKLHVFRNRDGESVIYAMVISDRFGDKRGDIYDAQWNWLDIEFGPYRRSDAAPPPPPNWADVLRIAKTLATDHDYVRVDLYSTGSAVYFGELTFTSGAGVQPFRPDSVDRDWGLLLKEACAGVRGLSPSGVSQRVTSRGNTLS
jgi:TupA-like ATPgrasp